MKKRMAMALALGLAVCSSAAAFADEPLVEEEALVTVDVDDDIPESAADQGYVIGFSDNFNGNTFHQQQEAQFQKVADQMVEAGIISEYYMEVANNDVALQVSQIQNFIMMGCNAIIIDPCSTAGLNGAIEEAIVAGIEVMIFNDGPVTSNLPYQLNADAYNNFGYIAEWACEKINYEGDALVIRGLAGNSYDELAYQGIIDVLNQYEGINVVGEVYGEWNATVAQQEVAGILPSLENVDVVIGQGGDAFGAAQAFEAAGRDVPLITAGHRGDFLNWWMKAYQENGYETVSGMVPPWFAPAALYLTIDILDGKDVPQYIYYPQDVITVDNLMDYEGIADTAVAGSEHDWTWVREVLETQDEVENKPSIIED